MARKPQTGGERNRKPTIEALRALAVLAEVGSMTETARRLGISQPVISKKLKTLSDEESCGALLIRPKSHGKLTEVAHAALPAIHDLISRYDRLLHYLRGEESAPRTLRIGTGSFAASHYLPAAIARLRPEYDDYQIETQVCRGRDRILATARGVFDLSVVTHDRNQVRETLRDARIDDSLIQIQALGRHPLCVIALKNTESGNTLQAIPADTRVPVSKLAEWELIGPDRESGLRRQLERRLPGRSFYFVAEGGGWLAAKEFARHGLGVAIIPCAAVTSADGHVFVQRTLQPEFDVRDFLIYPSGQTSPILQSALKEIKRAARRRSSNHEL